MRVEEIGMEHQKMLTLAFQKLKLNFCEYSFAELYLYRNVHKYKLIFSNHLFLSGLTYDQQRFLMPTVRLKDIPLEEIQTLLKDHDFLFPIPGEWLQDLPQDHIKQAYYVDDDNDYIFPDIDGSIREVDVDDDQFSTKEVKQNCISEAKNVDSDNLRAF